MTTQNNTEVTDVLTLALQALARYNKTSPQTKIKPGKVDIGAVRHFNGENQFSEMSIALPPLDMAAIRYDFEERIAIMMYDGGVPEREAINAALEEIL